jgi:DNA-binding GntR family transcriptional regulator
VNAGVPLVFSLREQIADQLRGDVLCGRLVEGQRVSELALVERFGVSRTPVRDAINQLAAFGVIRLYPNRGAQVQPFGPEQLRDIYLVRQILESEACRLACGRIAPDALDWAYRQSQALAQASDHSEDWARQQMEADRNLHDLIARSCGSERLRTEIQRYWTLIDAVRMSLGHRYEAREQAIREHLTIVDALQHGNAQAAAEAMNRHIQQTAEAAVNLMFGISAPRNEMDNNDRNHLRRGKRGAVTETQKAKG